MGNAGTPLEEREAFAKLLIGANKSLNEDQKTIVDVFPHPQPVSANFPLVSWIVGLGI